MSSNNKVILKTIAISESKITTRIFWITTFCILTAVGAQIEIPTQPVPFTLQTFFVLLSGAILGHRGGAISMGLYLMLGVFGLAVFAGGSFGLLKILGPTGGYLLSFPLAAWLVGYVIKIRSEYWWIFASMILGSLVIFTIGTIQLNYVYLHNWSNSFQTGFLIFSFWDVVKIVGASTIAHYYFKNVKHS